MSTSLQPRASAPAITAGTRSSAAARLMRQPARQVLVVDDEDAHAEVVARYLRAHDYDVTTAGTADRALELLRRQKFVAMLCDVGLPDVSGADLLPFALAIEPHLAVLMLTGADDASTATAVMADGAYDYLVKPAELSEVRAAVDRALVRREARLEQERDARFVRDEILARTSELERERTASRELTLGVVEALVSATEKKDVFLRGHSQRVAELAASIANAMGLDADTVEAVRLAGRLQDVGKIGIREEVLNKPGRLTPEEFEHVKSHVQIGVEILAPLTFLGAALDYVHHHHEHYNGGGYPQGLAGEQISIGGRILTAADAYDALTSRRPYREPLDQAETLELLAWQVGVLFDPVVFEALSGTVRGRQSLTFLEVVDA